VRRLDSDELENLTFYSTLNENLLNLGVELTRWVPDLGIVDLIRAHSSLANASETAGVERAVLFHAIATGELPRDGLVRLARLIGTQDVYLEMFFRHVAPEFHDLYHEKLDIPPTPEGLQHVQDPSSTAPFREAALSGDISGLDAVEWWTAASLRIDALDELENLLLNDLVAEGLMLRSDAWASVTRFVMVGLLALLGVVVAWVLGGKLAKRTRSLTAVTTAISSGDLDQRADPGGRDEFGILGEAFNDMVDHLTKLIADKDRFVATVSHELRTPLTTIMGYSDLLRSEASDFSQEERNEMVDTIAREASELSNLIQDLLVAARATDGSLTVAEVRVNLKAQTTQVIESPEPDTSTSVKIVGETTLATGDPMRVRQILRNLISNAIKYGGSKIEVRVQGGEQQVSILVADDGRGVDAEHRDLIFEPYEALKTAEAMPGSMGLGLAVSRTLARLMGGDVTYRYDNGESLFELTLPAWRSAEPDVEWASAGYPPATRETVGSAVVEF
jgi:signal transduction histidine kinase